MLEYRHRSPDPPRPITLPLWLACLAIFSECLALAYFSVGYNNSAIPWSSEVTIYLTIAGALSAAAGLTVAIITFKRFAEARTSAKMILGFTLNALALTLPLG